MYKHNAEEPSRTYVRQEECVRALKGETSDRRSSAVTMRSQHHCHWFSLSGLQMHRRWQICMLNQHLTVFGVFLLLFLHYNNKSKFTKQTYTVCVSNYSDICLIAPGGICPAGDAVSEQSYSAMEYLVQMSNVLTDRNEMKRWASS